MVFEVEGMVKRVLPATQGTSGYGTSYTAQTFILSEVDDRGEEYTYAFTLLNDNIERNAFCLTEGNVVRVRFGISTKQSQQQPDRYFTNLRFYMAQFISDGSPKPLQ